MEGLEDLKEECDRFIKLMSNPHPGLATWCEVVQTCVNQIKLLSEK